MLHIQDNIAPFIGGLSVVLNFISILVPWLSFGANSPSQRILNQLTPATESTGSIYLYQTLGCTKYVDSVAPTSPQATCALITTGNLPQSLAYMKDASNVAMAFTILSLITNVISLFFMSLVAVKRLTLIFDENGAYRARLIIVGSNLTVMVFNIISFGTFAGIFNAKFGLNTDAPLIGFGGTQNRSWGYGGGFGLSIVVTIISSVITVTEYLHKRDQETINTITNPMNPHPPPRSTQTHLEGV